MNQNLCYGDRIGWHVVYTGPLREEAVAREIRAAGFDVYLPMEQCTKLRRRKRVELSTPLFSRYLFVAFDPHLDDWQGLRDIDDVDDILRNNDVPSRVPAAWIEALRKAEGLGAFDRRKGAPQPFAIGETVRVTEGPFAGLHARVEQFVAKMKSTTSSKRAKVLLDFLGGPTITELPVVSLEKL